MDGKSSIANPTNKPNTRKSAASTKITVLALFIFCRASSRKRLRLLTVSRKLAFSPSDPRMGKLHCEQYLFMGPLMELQCSHTVKESWLTASISDKKGYNYLIWLCPARIRTAKGRDSPHRKPFTRPAIRKVS